MNVQVPEEDSERKGGVGSSARKECASNLEIKQTYNWHFKRYARLIGWFAFPAKFQWAMGWDFSKRTDTRWLSGIHIFDDIGNKFDSHAMPNKIWKSTNSVADKPIEIEWRMDRINTANKSSPTFTTSK